MPHRTPPARSGATSPRSFGVAMAALLALGVAACGSAPPTTPSAKPSSASAPSSSAARSTSPRTSGSSAGSRGSASSPPSPSPSPSPTASAPSPSPTPPAYPTLFPLPANLTNVGEIGGEASPRTAHIAEPLRAYPYQLGHCGILSGVDFDGSWWDAVGGQSGNDTPLTQDQVGELINATAGTIKLVGQNASLFQTKSGLVLGLARHGGKKSLTACM
jgi:hypothetical protein